MMMMIIIIMKINDQNDDYHDDDDENEMTTAMTLSMTAVSVVSAAVVAVVFFWARSRRPSASHPSALRAKTATTLMPRHRPSATDRTPNPACLLRKILEPKLSERVPGLLKVATSLLAGTGRCRASW